MFILEQSAWPYCTGWKREDSNGGRESNGTDNADVLGRDEVAWREGNGFRTGLQCHFQPQEQQHGKYTESEF